ARALQLEVRIDSHGDASSAARLLRERREAAHFVLRLDIDNYVCFERPPEFVLSLARAGEADGLRSSASRERDVELPSGRNVKPVDESDQMAHYRRHWIGLHRIVQM